MAEIHNLQAKTKLLHAQSLLLRLGESEAAKAVQKVVDRLGGKELMPEGGVWVLGAGGWHA